MAPKFGTSGLRGLVVELTPELVADHVRAFVAACETGGTVCVGRDLRPSSPRIAGDVIAAVRSMGVRAVDCGALPTPALALEAQRRGAAAVMVTGSHIPADRNGLKFYSTAGEITKADEQAITGALGTAPGGSEGAMEVETGADERFTDRYVDAFGAGALAGRHIGLYAHSAVGRELMREVFDRLGAKVTVLAPSDTFIPVDTEAVAPELRVQLAEWVTEHGLDALVSTDGDSDRPLMVDETGQVVPGDILGQITAELLEAETIVTPISSNSGVVQKGAAVVRTRIGSPYVIAGMEEAGGRVVGYEANGGFLLGFDALGLEPLVTRDCVLPLVAVLVASGESVSARVAQEPSVCTAADRLQEVPQELSQPFVAALASDAAARRAFLSVLGETAHEVDLTDGVRMTRADGVVLHVRPSGNAPELRLYVEAKSRSEVTALLDRGLAVLREAVMGAAA
ncbi:phosphomannomutase [Mesobacterium pallidum]|uniref:phosphomannomutase n=1 Tax=Mesobacterium pallidum TaxID=2872037 RepID=UPI001EE19BD8|nr:phosphomannomutase [Mesobacterium pallidum]